MMFLKRLFTRKEEPAAEQPHGAATEQTRTEQDATRKGMEAEVAHDRQQRDATEAHPDGGQSPAQGLTP